MQPSNGGVVTGADPKITPNQNFKFKIQISSKIFKILAILYGAELGDKDFEESFSEGLGDFLATVENKSPN